MANPPTQVVCSDRRNYVLGLLTLVYSVNFIDRQLLVILQESIKVDLDLSDTQLGLLTGFAFAMFYVTAGIPIARWADNGNRRNIISLAIFSWSFMTVVSGAAQNYAQLLLARIGVGVGEAGSNPASMSIISDVFPKEKRVGAMGIYGTGVYFGILFGFLFGGWINHLFGWRMAFLVVGGPGLVLALIVRLSLKEPVRKPIINPKIVTVSPSNIFEICRYLWGCRTFRHMMIATALNASVGYGMTNWIASYMIRSHDMKTGELGTWLAIIIGVGGIISVYFSGVVAERLAAKNKKWLMWLPGIAGLAIIPFLVGMQTATNKYLALSLSVAPSLLLNVYVSVTLATCQNLVNDRMRATTSAIYFFILNVIGLGLGASSVGVLSDYLQPYFGAESLRYAMLILLPTVSVWSAAHFFIASRTLVGDLNAAPS